jgi:hypothetical protein
MQWQLAALQALAFTKEKRVAAFLLQPVDIVGGVDGTRTRDPRRDRPVF